jgi:cell wall-associated NlpC family hydrolase
MAEGVGLPHNARMQFRLGQPVGRSAMLPGDLVFFNTRGPLTHVGVYIGNDQFLHAANPRRGVRIDQLSSPYYAKRFAGARRYKNIG